MNKLVRLYRHALFRPLLAFLAGALAVLGYAPFELFPLSLLSLAILFALWQDSSQPAVAARLGWLWGCGFFLCGVSWVFVSLHVVGGMPVAIAVAATVFLCCTLALYPALAGALHVWLSRLASAASDAAAPASLQARVHPLRQALLFAGLWAFTEWLRGWWLGGFPWLASGYAHTPPSPLAGYAAITGVYGMGLLAALISALAWLLIQPGKARRTRLLCLSLILGLCATGQLLRGMPWTQPQGEPLSVSLLQGNIPQESKWDAERVPMSLITYARLLYQHPADLVVMPETALPLFLDEVPADYLALLRERAPVLTGVATFIKRPGKSDGYANTALGLTPDGRMQGYSKHHLVPFGEYTPPGFAWFMGLMHMPMSDFTPGAAYQAPLQLAGQQIAANICYEDLFGEEIIRALPQATLLINLSNTAWFGASLAQPQHLQIARLRAMESGRYMLRATNTGMTAAIAPDGRVLEQLPPFTRGGITLKVQGHQGATPYVRWGNALAVVLCLLCLLPTLRAVRRSTCQSKLEQATPE